MPKFTMLMTLLIGGLLGWGPALGQPAITAPKPAGGRQMEARVDQRIEQMHRRLKITPEQQTAWDAFAQAMRRGAASTEQAYRQRSGSVETITAPENLHNFAEIEQARAQNVQTLATSFDALYGNLSDEQKKTADAMFRHFGLRGEGRPRGVKKPG